MQPIDWNRVLELRRKSQHAELTPEELRYIENAVRTDPKRFRRLNEKVIAQAEGGAR